MRPTDSRWPRRSGAARLWCLLLFAALLLVMTLAITWGPVDMPAGTVWRIAWSRLLQVLGMQPPPLEGITPQHQQIVWLIRMPRVLLAALVGAGLAVVGTIMQAMVRNAGEIGGLIAAIAGASQTQGEGIAEVREAIAGLDQAAQQNAATVQDVTAAAHLLQEHSQALAGMLSEWRWDAAPAAAMAATPFEPALEAAPAAPVQWAPRLS